MIKNNLLSFLKGFLLSCGLTLISWNSPLYLQNSFKQNQTLDLFAPFILSFLIFIIFLTIHSLIKNNRSAMVSSFRENLKDRPYGKQWGYIFIIGFILALSTFLTNMTPIAAIMNSIFLDQKNFTYLAALIAVMIFSKKIAKRIK